MITTIRLLRTPSSERFLLQERERDCGALDLHYLSDGSVHATVIIYEGGIAESDVPNLLTQIDENLLPSVSLDDKKLIFTVVMGRVLGAYEAEKQSADQSRGNP